MLPAGRKEGHMPQALHSRFANGGHDPALTFPQMAPDILDIDELIELFGEALAGEGATGHRCFVLDADGGRILLTQGGQDGEQVSKWLPNRRRLISFDIESADGEPLLMTIDLPKTPDRRKLARLHMLAVVYTAHAVPLIEAEDREPPAPLLTPTERQCLQLVVAGLSHLDIGERLDRSPAAVGLYLRRAAARLGAPSTMEACTIALARGLLI